MGRILIARAVIGGLIAITAGALYMRMPKKLTASGLEVIKMHEGWSAVPYADKAGHMTIGYGHKILPGERFTTLTVAEGEQLLMADAEKAVKAVNAAVKVPVTQNMFNALVSFTFNVGAGGLRRSTTLERLNAGNYIRASEALELWNKITVNGSKVVDSILVTRRAREQELFWT